MLYIKNFRCLNKQQNPMTTHFVAGRVCVCVCVCARLEGRERERG